MNVDLPFNYVCPTCHGNGMVGETNHPDPAQREDVGCPLCLGDGYTTLADVEAYDVRRALEVDDYLPPVRTLVPVDVYKDQRGNPDDDPWGAKREARVSALAVLYGREEAERLDAIEPPC